MKSLKVVFMFVAVLILCSCSEAIQAVKNMNAKDPSLCQSIVPGQTTREAVETESMLGKPSGIEYTHDGGEVRTYGSFTVHYDPKGRVTEFSCKKG